MMRPLIVKMAGIKPGSTYALIGVSAFLAGKYYQQRFNHHNHEIASVGGALITEVTPMPKKLEEIKRKTGIRKQTCHK